MLFKSLRLAAVATLFAAALTGASQASPAGDAFAAACTANPTFFDFTGMQLASNPEGHAAVCGCLVTEFGSLPDDDLAMLTKDVDGTATAEERTGYANYNTLQNQARAALTKCFQTAGLVDAPEPTNTTGEPADMTRFNAACTASEALLGILDQDATVAGERRVTFCGCLNEELATRITTADADELSKDLDSTATEESKAAYANYAAASAVAGEAFSSCMSKLGS